MKKLLFLILFLLIPFSAWTQVIPAITPYTVAVGYPGPSCDGCASPGGTPFYNGDVAVPVTNTTVNVIRIYNAYSSQTIQGYIDNYNTSTWVANACGYAGTASWVYIPITPITLTAGVSYIVGYITSDTTYDDGLPALTKIYSYGSLNCSNNFYS